MRRLLLSIILICLLTLPASAHPGGTDSSGGHYDHSTGEYHYHHGYGPHEHEDLDGDGDLDCPYDFKDKTGENSGESSGSTTRYPAYTRPAVPLPTKPAPAVAEPVKESGFKTAWEVVKVVGILVIGFFIAAFAGIALSVPVAAVQLAFLWLREHFGKRRKEPEWRPSPQRIPGKRPNPEPPVKQLSFFEEPKPEQAGDPDKLIWKSAYEEMKYTRITDRYIHIKDLELVASYFSVDTDTALRLLNDDRIHNGMPPLELLKV